MAMAWPSLFCMNREAFGLRIVKVNIEKVEKISKKACKLKKVMVCLYPVFDTCELKKSDNPYKYWGYRIIPCI